MIQEFPGACSRFCRPQVFAVLFSILMVSSIVAPVGAVGGSTVGEDDEWADGTEGLLSVDQDGDSSVDEDESTVAIEGEEVGDSDPEGDGSDDATAEEDDRGAGANDRISPTQFDTAEGDVLWETAESLPPGASPTVVDGILVTSTGGTGDANGVAAYDVGTGEKRWSVPISVDGSPTVVDGMVYISGGEGVWALDLELGAVEWHVTEAVSQSRALGVDGEYVYVGVERTSDELVALDATDGTEQWSTETADILSGPTVVDGIVYVGTDDGITAIDTSSKEEVWSWDADGVLADRSAITEPVVSDGFLHVSLRNGTEQGGYERSTVAIDVETGEDVWMFDDFGDPSAESIQTPRTPTVSGEGGEATVYVGFDKLYALNASDGTERWTDDSAPVWDEPTVADGTLFVPQTTESEELRALDVTDDGSELWSVETGERSGLIVVDGVLYVTARSGSEDERLMAIDAGVSSSSSDSRVMLGVQNNHHAWTGSVPEADPHVVDVAFDEGVFVEEEISVTVTARNDWSPTTTASFDGEIDGETEIATLEVPAYGTNDVDLTIPAPDEAGTYDLEVGGEGVGTITVVDDDDPMVRVVQPFYETWLEGESIQIAYEATNHGTEYVDENTTLSLEGPAFDGREDVAFVDAEGPEPGEERTYFLNTEEITDSGTYTAYLEDEELGTISVVSDPVYLADTNRLHDTIVSGVQAPVDPSAAGEASIDVRYENLLESEQSVESELVAYDDEGIEVATDTRDLDVDGESAVTERLSVTLAEAGTYDLEVDGQSVGAVEVLVDGVQDGDSIQDAIDAAQPGDTIFVGNGTYEESLTIDKELTLRSVSDGGVVLDGGNSGIGSLATGVTHDRAISVESPDVTVDGFRIEGYSGGGEAVFVSDDRFTLRNSTLVDNDGAALSINQNSDEFSIDTNEIRRNAAGIVDVDDWYPSDDGTVTNNTIEDNQGLGIELAGDDHGIAMNNVSGNGDGISATGSGLEIRHNNVTATDGFAIQVRGDSVVADNTIEDADYGIRRDGTISMDGVVIEGNTFHGVSQAIPHAGDDSVVRDNEFSGTETDLVLDDAINATVTDNEFVTGVRIDGVPEDLDEEPHEMAGNTVGGDPLVYAVDEDDPELDSSAGQLILVDVSNVEIDEHSFSNVIAGVQVTHSDSVEITGGDFTDIGDGGAISVWHSSSVTVDEIDVTDAERGVYVHESDGVTVSNGTFTAVGATAIHADGVEELSIVGNGVQVANRGLHVLTADELTVMDNVIEGSSTGVQFGRLSTGGRSTSEDVTFTNNTITGSSGDGVKLDHGSLTGVVTISDTTVRDNGGVGMDLDVDGVSATVVNNTVRDNDGDAGFDLSVEGEAVTIVNNTVRNNDGDAGFALDVEGETATISNNVVTNNDADVGFDIHVETTDGTIESNTIRHNVDGLVVTGETAFGVNVTITENLIEENTGTGLTVSDHFESVLVTENSIADNDDGLHYNRGDDVVLDATNNWWGAADGPSGDPTDPAIDPDAGEVAEGSGDSITTSDRWWLHNESVRFSPWLESPFVETGTISGTVVDGDGNPVSGVSVQLSKWDDEFSETTTTDTDGSFVASVPEGHFTVTAEKDGYSGDVGSFDVSAGEQKTIELEIQAIDSGTLSGQVTAEDGAPISDADVEVIEQVDVGDPDPEPDGFTATLSTDGNGEFEVDVPSGVYKITLEASGYGSGVEQDIEVEAGESVGIDDIVLTAEPSTGTVVGYVNEQSTDDPVQGAFVSVSGAPNVANTDVDGFYELELEPGTHTLEVFTEHVPPLTGTADVEVIEGETVIANISVAPDTGSPELAVLEAGVSDSEPETGDEVTITASVENVGSETGTVIVPLEINGTVVDQKEVELDTDESETVEFEYVFDEAGEYAVSVDGVDAGMVSVLRAPKLVAYGSNVHETSIELGAEDVVVSASLINTGDVEGTETIELVADELGSDSVDTVAEKETTVAPGKIESLELTWDPSENHEFDLGDDLRAEFDIYLGDLYVDTVAVEHRESDIQVIAASASETEVIEGESFHVVGSIYQAGTIDGPEDITLNATPTDDGTPIQLNVSEDVSVSPGFYHLGGINLTGEFEDGQAGTYTLDLGGRDAGEIEVVEAYSDVQVIAASADAGEVLQDESFTVTGSIYQAGTAAESEEVTLNATLIEDAAGESVEDGETIELGNQSRTVAPNVYHLGGIDLSVAFDEDAEPGTYKLELGDRDAGTIVVIEAYSDVQVIAAAASANEVIEDEELHVIGSVYQDGTITDDEEIDLTATNTETNETKTIATQNSGSIAPNTYHLGALNVSFSFDEPGTYELELGDRPAGTVDVEPAESDIQVIAAALSEGEVVAGEDLHVVGSIYQDGNIAGPQNISLTAVDQVSGETTNLTTVERTVNPNVYHLGAINETFTLEEDGTYDIYLGDRNAGTLEVEPAYSDVQVIAAAADAMNVSVGEEFHVIGSVYQAGTAADSEEIALNATPLDDDGDLIETETVELGVQENVTLAPNVYYLGALNITASFADDQTGEYALTLGDRDAGTIYVEESPSDIQVIAASLSEIEVLEGEQLNVTGSVYQNGTGDVEQTIELTAIDQDTGNEIPLGTQSMTLAANVYHLGAVDIDFAIDEPGTYDLYLDGHHAGELEVIEAYSDVQVIAAAASANEVIEGEELYAIGSVYQDGTVTGDEEIELTATNVDNGETTTVGTQNSGSIAPNTYHLGALNVSFSFDEPGTYELELGDRPAGTVDVEPAESDIQVIAAALSEGEIVGGEELHVVGSIYQDGNIAGPQNISLTAVDQESGEETPLTTVERTVTPNVYHLGAINETFTLEEDGTYDIFLGDRNAGTLEVEPAYSDVQVIAASADAMNVSVGEELHVIGSLYQSGTISGDEEIELTATNVDNGETTTVGTQNSGSIAPNVYHLGALNISFSFDQAGAYELDLGDRPAGTVEVREPIVEPSIADVDGHSSAIDPDFDERTATYANDDVTVELDVESDLPIESAFVHVSSIQTNYLVEIEAEPDADGTLIAEIPIEDDRVLSDDGGYDLSVIAVDEHGTVGTSADTELLVIDTEAPTMSVSIEDVTSDDATVVVESDEPLSSTPSVSLDVEDLSTQSSTSSIDLEPTDTTNTTFEGTLTFDGSGEYTVEVTGTDRAGNEVTDSTDVVHHEFTLEDGVLEIPGIDVQVVLDVVGVHEEIEQELAMALAESETNANLDGGAHGVGFLQTELPGLLDAHLEGAEIAMPVDDDELPTGFDETDVELQHYDSQTGEWTTVEDASLDYGLGDDPHLVAGVSGFSTYGAVIPDTTPPEISTVSPTDGTEYSSDTDEVAIAFEYTDDLSGIDVSSIELEVNGTLQTDPDVTMTNSTTTTHTHTVSDGEDYEVTLWVGDEAGNVANETVTFSVEATPDSGGPGGAISPAPSDPDDDGDDVDEGADDGPDDDGTDAGGSDDGADDTTGPSTGSDDVDDAAGDDDTIPGFGVILAVIALLLAAAIGFRRR